MTPALSLRPLRVADADAMVEVLADPSLHLFTGDEPPTREELAARYARQVVGRSADGSEQWLNWIVLAGPDQRPVGYVQATVPVDGDTAEISWVIGTPWQGRGHATGAARLMVKELARRGVHHLVAHIHPDHEASSRVATHLGLVPTDVMIDGEIRWTGSAGPGTKEPSA